MAFTASWEDMQAVWQAEEEGWEEEGDAETWEELWAMEDEHIDDG